MRRIILISGFLLSYILLLADNPIIPDIGMSDPHIRVFNDTVYLYCGNDSHPDDKTWVMNNWRVFQTTDLINWTLIDTISPEDNYMPDASSDCWAGDASSRNNLYYFYFSDQKRSIGVMSAKHPSGPYIDSLSVPLVAPMHDPTLLMDDDPEQTPYLVYGDKEGSYRIARLNLDMTSLAEDPQDIIIKGEEWENAPFWMDKNYLFKYQNTYYLSWGRDYAIADNPYGPYTCAGSVGKGHHLNEFAHGSFFWWQGQFYHIWCYYIRPGFKYRESIITYCHFSNDGLIVSDTDYLDKHFRMGVGQYDARWERIEAEWYYGKSADISKRECKEGGFEVAEIATGNWLCFANMTFIPGLKKCTARIHSTGSEGTIEIRVGSVDGKLLGTCNLESDVDGFYSVSCSIDEIQGEHDIYFSFQTEGKETIRINWFNFE